METLKKHLILVLFLLSVFIGADILEYLLGGLEIKGLVCFFGGIYYKGLVHRLFGERENDIHTKI